MTETRHAQTARAIAKEIADDTYTGGNLHFRKRLEDRIADALARVEDGSDHRLILNQQHEAHRVASVYGVWEREKNELHILRALQDAARRSAPPEGEQASPPAERAHSSVSTCRKCGRFLNHRHKCDASPAPAPITRETAVTEWEVDREWVDAEGRKRVELRRKAAAEDADLPRIAQEIAERAFTGATQDQVYDVILSALRQVSGSEGRTIEADDPPRIAQETAEEGVAERIARALSGCAWADIKGANLAQVTSDILSALQQVTR